MTDKETIILGGGLSGLAVSHYMNGKCLVLEADEIPGGLCRSFKKDGFTYDIGGHIMFSRNQELLMEMVGWLKGNVHQQKRKNVIWYKDRYVKYPFENGLHALEKEEIFECLYEFLNRPADNIPDNLRDWCTFRFGSGIADKYLIPYNEKIWKRDLRQMAATWVERIPSPPMEDILKSAIGIETEGYTHQLYFYYPKAGGIHSLVFALAENTPGLQTGCRITKIRKRNSEWEVSDGEKTYHGERLVSTIPVFELFKALEKVPDAVLRALDNLQYNSLILGMVAVNHEGLNGTSAIYIPDPEIPPHRVCFMKYFSENNGPEGKSHLITELTVPPDDTLLQTDNDVILEQTVNRIKDVCGFTKNEIISSDLKKLKYEYVIYDMDYTKNVKTVFSYLESIGIYYTGRFGSFKYINMDSCVEMAKNLVSTFA